MKQAGVGWDPSTNNIDIPDDKWEEFIKRNLKIESFRRKGCEHYDVLGEIFDTITATGQPHYASTQGPLESEEELELEEEFPYAGVHVDATPEMDTNNDLSGLSQLVGRKRRRLISVSERAQRSRSKSKETEMSSEFQALTKALVAKREVSLARANRYKEAHEAISSFRERYLIGNCIDILESMEGYEDSQYLLAIEKFMNIGPYREFFIHMSELRRSGG